MTASQVASAFSAKRASKGKWMAKCPSHQDRMASLSIREGTKCVLINCFGGCDKKDILDAVGLKYSDLFYNKLPTRDAIRESEERRKIQEQKHRAERIVMRSAIDRARKWEMVVGELGKLLHANLDDEKLAELLHRSIDMARVTQEAIKPYFHPVIVPGQIPCYRGKIHGIKRADVTSEIAVYLRLSE